MTSISFMCWRNVISKSTVTFEDAYPGFPPLKIYPNGNLDLEFAPFLLADSIIMDSTDFDRLTHERPKGLERAIASLKVLDDKGHLKLVDYTTKIGDLRPKILAASELRLETVEHVREAVKNAIKMWDSVGPNYAAAIGRQKDPLACVPVGILAGLAADGGTPDDQKRIANIRKIVFEKKRLSAMEKDLLREVTRPYIDHVHTGIAVHRALGAPVMDWEDTGPVYSSVLLSSIEPIELVQKRAQKVRELFSVGLSEFEPSNVDEYLSAMKNKYLLDFRKFIAEAENRSTSFDEKFIQEVLRKIHQNSAIFNRSGTVINAVGTGAGLLAACFDGGTTLALLTGAGIGTGQELAARTISDMINHDIKWFLCLVDAKRKKK